MNDHEREEEETAEASGDKPAHVLVWVQLAAASVDLVWSVVEAVRTIMG